jgi:hypothetical protein
VLLADTGDFPPSGTALDAMMIVYSDARVNWVGLEFDDAFLSHYRPCFNSEQDDSMTFMYRLRGSHARPICATPNSNEAIHQSAVDRKQ